MTWWQYLMLVNIYLLLFYGFYVLLLSRETFFQLNRIYLVSAALLSFFIPVIQSDRVKNLFITQKVQYTIYSSPVLRYQFRPIQDTHFTIGQLIVIVYLAGMAFLMARFALQLISLNKIINKLPSAAPYSFFKKIKLGDDDENTDIIAAHENVHAREWHSVDVLIMEAVLIINWFNPVVYLYRFAVKHIHEFIADRQALKSGTNKADYALILLSQTFNAPTHQLVNPFFNKSLLKQRILMLQKNKSHRVALIKYFLSAPLFILMLILSSATVNNSNTIRLIDKKMERVFLKPAVEGTDAKTTNSLPKNVDFLSRQTIKAGAIGLAVKRVRLVAVNDTNPRLNGPVFTSVEKVPEFPGGFEAFIAFLGKNVRYPAGARENNVQGRVIIGFVVETDGALSNFKIARGIGYGCDEEALRVLQTSPKWKPGTQNGKLVRVAYSIPINFSLSKEEQPTGQKNGAINGDQNNQKITLGSMNLIVSKTNTGVKLDTVNTKDPLLSPLYIVDGIEASNLTILNPADIESISVLKGKSATVLYGPKGANGVVIVKMKNNRIKNLKLAPAKN